jgi:MFS transporter, ACS family, tartrate transporter
MASSQATSALPPVADGIVLERETMAKVMRRLIPLLMVCYFTAYLDRVNVGFAALTMNKALGFSAAVFGLGSGIFFVG